MHRWVIFGLFRTGRLRISLGLIKKIFQWGSVFRSCIWLVVLEGTEETRVNRYKFYTKNFFLIVSFAVILIVVQCPFVIKEV